MPAPRELTTDRLLLRPPRIGDAEAVFERYASDAEATRYVGFVRHASIEDTHQFIEHVLSEWSRDNPVAYLAFARDGGQLVGSAGVVFEIPTRAFTGYILAPDAWGRGLATEMARSMVGVAFGFPQLRRLYATCHVDNRASERVLSKAGLQREGTLRRHSVFPNLGTSEPQDIAMWARVRDAG